MNFKHTVQFATAVSLALALSTATAADDTKPTTSDTTMTGKQKATAIGATTGAVAGAVVAGPVGAVVGAGVGALVGNQGTDANGKVVSSDRASSMTVRNAQSALNAKGYDVSVDGQWGPNTQAAVRRFQSENGLAQSGTLDAATRTALGVS